MEKVTKLRGGAIGIRRSNIDTDQIIPAYWMKRVERNGYQDGLFERWREDPQFVMNRPESAGATVLVAGRNFGCGSSREHAVWALRDWGIRAVIAPSIADIHRGNLPQEGIVPVEVDEDSITALFLAIDRHPMPEVEIDVVNRTLTCGSADLYSVKFRLDGSSHFTLTNGLDPVDQTLRMEDKISRYEANRDPWLPSTRYAESRNQERATSSVAVTQSRPVR